VSLRETLTLDVGPALTQIKQLGAAIKAATTKIAVTADVSAAAKAIESLKVDTLVVPIRLDTTSIALPKLDPIAVTLDIETPDPVRVEPLLEPLNDVLHVDAVADLRPLVAPPEQLVVDARAEVSRIDKPNETVVIDGRVDIPKIDIPRTEAIVPVRFDIPPLDLPTPELVIPVRYDDSGATGGSGGGGGGGGVGLLGLLGAAGISGPAAAAAAAGAATAASIKASIGAFADYEQGVAQILTLLPTATQETFDQIGKNSLAFSKDYGRPITEVLQGVYEAVSSGVPVDNVFDFMTIASKAATAGVTDTDTAVNGLTSVVNAFGKSLGDPTTAADDFATAADVLFATVNFGKTTFPELARNIADVSPIASSLGVDFKEVGAAIAAVTAIGVPTTIATTQIRSALAELSSPTQKAAQNFEELTGKSFPNFIKEGGTVADAFNILREEADRVGVPVTSLFGSIEAGQAVLALTGENAGRFNQFLGEMEKSAGSTDKAFGIMSETIGFKWGQLKQIFATGLVNLGDVFKPLVNAGLDLALNVLPKIGEATAKVREFFVGLAEDAGQLLGRIDFTAAGNDVAGFGKQVAQAYADNIVPFFTALRETATVYAGVLGDALSGVGRFLRDDLGPALAEGARLWEPFKEAVVAVATAIGDLVVLAARVGTAIAKVVAFVAQLDVVRDLVSGLGNLFGGILVDAVRLVIDILDRLLSLIKNVAEAISALANGDILGFLKNLGQAFGDLLGAVKDLAVGLGGALLGALKNVGAIVLDVFSNLGRYALDGLKALTSVAGDVAAALGGLLLDGIRAIPDLAADLGSKLLDLLRAGITGAAGFAADVGAALGQLILDGLSALPSLAADVARTVGRLIIDGLAGLAALSFEVGQALGKLLLDGIKALPSLAADLAGVIGDAIANGVSNIGAIAGLAGRVGGAIGNMLVDGIKAVADLSVRIGEAIANLVVDGVQGAGSLASRLGEGLGTKIREGIAALPDLAADFGSKVGELVVAGITGLTSLGEDLGRAIGAKIKEGIDLIQDIPGAVASLGEKVKQLVTDAVQFIKDVDWAKVAADIADGIVNAVTALTDFGSRLGQAVAEKAKEIGTFIANIDWSQVAETIKNGIATAIQNADKVALAAGMGALILGAIALLPVIIVGGLVALGVYIASQFLLGLRDALVPEDIGGTIGGAFTAATPYILAPIQPIIDSVVAAWGLLSPAIGTVINTIVPVVTTGFGLISGAVQTAMGIIQTVVTTGWTIVQTIIGTALTVISTGVSTQWNIISTTISTIMNTISTNISTVWNTISTTITTILTTISNTVTTNWNTISTTISTILNTILQTVTTIWNNILNTITTILNQILSTITTIWNTIRSTIETAMNTIRGVIETGWNTIRGVIDSAMNTIRGIIDSGWNTIRGIIDSAMSTIRGVIDSGWNAIRGVVQTAVNAIEGAVSGAFNTIRGIVEGAMSAARSAVDGFITIINTAISTIGNFVSRAGELSGVGGIISGALGAASGIFSAISDAAGAAAGAVGRVADAIRNLPSMPSVGGVLGAVNPFEWGGVVDRPLVGLVGEAGRELILPLTKSWEYQRSLLAQTGVLQRLFAEFQRGRSASDVVSSSNTHIAEGDTIINVNMQAPPSRVPVDVAGAVIGRRILNTLATNTRRGRRR